MYGVYIVDDEWLIVENLINYIPWNENGFEVIGSSVNPVKAISEILEKKPQLIFCDLKMPSLDGITLLKKVRHEGLDCEFVMLSAFGEFEASRSFYRLDGFDYLLKPLNGQEAEILLERLSRKISLKTPQKPVSTLGHTNVPAFDEIIEYITKNCDKKHTLEKLSTKFNISQSHICGLFSKYYGSSFTVFLTNIRMKEAARLIIETETAFKEIAIQCGYSDYFYFYRVFKGYFGISPTEYQQRSSE